MPLVYNEVTFVDSNDAMGQRHRDEPVMDACAERAILRSSSAVLLFLGAPQSVLFTTPVAFSALAAIEVDEVDDASNQAARTKPRQQVDDVAVLIMPMADFSSHDVHLSGSSSRVAQSK